MADIARAMGVGVGTPHLYVESKEALSHPLVARMLLDPGPAPPSLPVKSPPAGATITLLQKSLTLEGHASRLSATLARSGIIADFDDLEEVIGELYDSAHHRHVGINLIERSAIDWPEMEDAFFRGFRPRLLQAVEAYLKRGIACGALRSPPDTTVAARYIIEAVVWFAIHRHGDPLKTTALLLARNLFLIAAFWTLPYWLGLDGLFWAIPATDVVVAAVSAALPARGLRTTWAVLARGPDAANT
jgi:AcrR family transcriptional regulator